MIFTLLLMTGVLISPSVALMSLTDFNRYILPRCYKLVNREITEYAMDSKPLANTLDNFIHLVEKLELANPNLELSNLLLYLLKNYTIENLKYQNKFMVEKLVGSESYEDKIWENEKNNRLPNIEDPLDDDEKCALYFMLTYTIDKLTKKSTSMVTLEMNSGTPRDFDGLLYADDNNVALRPREQGVVAIHNSKEHTVAMARVIIGLYQGLNRVTKTFEELGKKTDPGEYVSIDLLYALTLSDILVVSQWTLLRDEERGFRPNGEWKQSDNCELCHKNGNPCPLAYLLPEGSSSVITYSAVRGGADGLILGLAIKNLYQDTGNRARLSQILRMYYSPRGIPYKDDAFTENKFASYCDRTEHIVKKEINIEENMKKYERLITQDIPDEGLVKSALVEFRKKRDDILNLGKNGNSQCSPITAENPLCETPTDVFIVLDTSTEETKLKDQQLTTGLLASHMDLWQGGSTMSVFVDQRNGSSDLGLSSIVLETSSSAKAACYSSQFDHSTVTGGREEEDFLVQSLDKMIRDMKKEQVEMNGVPAKVLVYFKFAQELKRNDYKLDKALKDFHLEHQDVPIYAVGENPKVLKKYAVGDIDTIIAAEFEPSNIASQLKKKICEAPASFQYKDCMKSASAESSAVYYGTVTPNHTQYWAVHPKYFHKSFTLKINVEAIDGKIKVCSNRANSRPDLNKVNCNITQSGRPFEVKVSNPCKGFILEKCSAIYFSIIGLKDENGEKENFKYCQENDNIRCKTLEQIRFKVTHEGMRCSGCLGVMSTPLVLFLSCILVYFLTSKNH